MNTAIIKPQWGPLTIGLMVLGFIFWWPIGLAMLAYILWGEHFGGSAEKAGGYFNKGRQAWAEKYRNRHGHGNGWQNESYSGNAAFDEYRSETLRRLEEERKRLDEEINAFHEYVKNLRMARDREEFDRFMRDRTSPRQGFGDGPSGTNEGRSA